MKQNREKREWLYYRSPYKYTLDNNEYNDPLYLKLNFPHRENYRKELLNCSLENFIKEMISIFLYEYPWEYGYIETGQMEWDDGSKEVIEGTNMRELRDIHPLEFEEHYDSVITLNYLKISFVNPQIEVFNWIEDVINEFVFDKEELFSKEFRYQIKDSVIESIRASKEYLLIKIDRKGIKH
ncbi:hypothetical protein [Tenacibaculum xiamenense]|uniref:hypothetical protein n=1 Tax=Tenacibaculum xiamenense TaxID=1261553 RepID=UPI003893316B